MSGKKGRSGRKPLVLEQLKDKVVAKAWNKLNYAMGLTSNQALSIAKDVCVKDMATKVDAQVTHLLTDNERIILDKYSKPIDNTRLDMITGNTAQATENNPNGVVDL